MMPSTTSGPSKGQGEEERMALGETTSGNHKRCRWSLPLAFALLAGVATLVAVLVSTGNRGDSYAATTEAKSVEMKTMGSVSLPTTTSSPTSATTTAATSTMDPSTIQTVDPSLAPTAGSLAPTAGSLAPTAGPITASPTTTPIQYYGTRKGCLPDRFDNEGMDLTVDPPVNFNRLYPGQFLCSKPYSAPPDNSEVPQRYRFGMTDDTGDIIWIDTVTDETVLVMENPNPSSIDGHYLTLTTTATMVYHYYDQDKTDAMTTALLKTSNLKYPMQTQPSRCISNHDCPYFHIHADGVMVLNYIAADGTGWEARDFIKAYGLD